MVGPTTDHEEIRHWGRTRSAVPAEVHPLSFDGEPAVLRFLFGNPPETIEDVKPITWEHFFALFDLMGLSLVYNGENNYELLQIEAKSLYRFDGKPM